MTKRYIRRLDKTGKTVVISANDGSYSEESTTGIENCCSKREMLHK